jgi:DNA-binding NtrC family response regulator
MPATLLVVEDETMLARSIKRSLEREGHTVLTEATAEAGLDRLREVGPELVLLDLWLPRLSGMEFLRTIRAQGYETGVIVMSAHGAVQSAVEAMRLGAYDYITKPLDLDELKIVVSRALEHASLSRELAYFRERDRVPSGSGLPLGECPRIREVRAAIARIATMERAPGGGAPSVLVLGETGTGKGVVARAIHGLSPRAAGPFIDVHCAALPETLLEAELFGYERGAFTGAHGARPGLFEASNGGTLFLDEIGHMGLTAQAKLLKVLEERTFRRLGSTAERKLDVRIIAATNRDLDAACAKETFLAELYHRLNVLTVRLPPLRERGPDIVLLAEHFARTHAAQYGLPFRPFSSGAARILATHRWPGNVRELANEVERAVLLEHGEHLELAHLAGAVASGATARVAARSDAGPIEVELPSGGIAFDDIERGIFLTALEAAGWNVSQAARFLRISRETLRYRMERLKITAPAPG